MTCPEQNATYQIDYLQKSNNDLRTLVVDALFSLKECREATGLKPKQNPVKDLEGPQTLRPGQGGAEDQGQTLQHQGHRWQTLTNCKRKGEGK